MKYILIVIATMCGLLCTNRQKPNRDYFHYFEYIMENYYYYYYQYPDSASEIIRFMEYSTTIYPDFDHFPENEIILSEILPILSGRDIQIKNDDYFTILQGDDTLFCRLRFLFSPCDIDRFIGKSSKEYYRFYSKFSRPRFFDKAGHAVILPEKVIEFQNDYITISERQIEISKTPFRYYINESGEVPIYLFLEYELGKGLRDFCSKEEEGLNGFYYQSLDSLCHDFCINNRIERIVFPSFDYR